MVENRASEDLLCFARAFRDQLMLRTRAGRYFVDALYAFQPELIPLILEDGELASSIARLFSQAARTVRIGAPISGDLLGEADALLAELGERMSFEGYQTTRELQMYLPFFADRTVPLALLHISEEMRVTDRQLQGSPAGAPLVVDGDTLCEGYNGLAEELAEPPGCCTEPSSANPVQSPSLTGGAWDLER